MGQIIDKLKEETQIRNSNCKEKVEILKTSDLKHGVNDIDSVEVEFVGDCLIEVESNLAVTGKFRLLVDTGASISIIDQGCINENVYIDKSKSVLINGIFAESKKTLGNVEAFLLIKGNEFSCNFQVINNENLINADGIMGMDFLKNMAKLDFLANKLILKNKQECKVQSGCYNIGEKMLMKMGYENGKGLGKNAQGMLKPIEFKRQIGKEGFGFVNKQAKETVISFLVGGNEEEKLIEKRFNLLKENVKLNENFLPLEGSTISNILFEYNDIFHLPGDKLSYTNIKTFKLPLFPEAGIVSIKQYRLPEIHKKEAQTQIEKMLEDGIIENSISPFNSPMILVSKKGTDPTGAKKFRLCIDFRKLNDISIPYQYPLPRIEEILDKLGNSKYFSTLDLSQGFHQVLIDKEDREKTAFSTTFGHYQYKRCPFGLKTVPGFFQALLNGVLNGLQGTKCFVYIDDVVIFGKSLEEHNDRLIQVMQRFRSSNLKLNPEKCRFLEKEIKYLGHRCSEEGVKPDDGIIKTIMEFKRPDNIKSTQSFLGLANYYRRFIKDLSKIAAPLYKLTQKTTAFIWKDECESAFTTLKKLLTSAPILSYPDFKKEFIITCDASGEGVGAVLEQENRVIVYASKVLSATKKRWSATELELYAIVFGCQEFKCYVLGTKFKIYSDHRPLSGILKVRDTTARIIKLQQKLSEFDYEIIYKKGRENSVADFLSRHPLGSEEKDLKSEICNAITRKQAKEVEIKNSDTTAKETDLDLISIADENELESSDNNKQKREVITDKNEIDIILRDYHDAPMGGHFGYSKTYDKIRQKFKWDNMKVDISTYIRNCKKCQMNKNSRATKMPMVLVEESNKPFEKIYVDIVGPLPVSDSGNKYILSMVDDLTRFVEFAPMPDQMADTVARTLYENILFRYTIPKQIVTDNGANFVGSVFKQLCKMLGIKKLRTTAYHPQSNIVERQHSSLANYLRNYSNHSQSNWDNFLRAAAHAYNNTKHCSTGFAPMEMLFGFVSETPSNLKREPEPLYNHSDYCHELRYKLQLAFNIAKKNLLRKKIKSKENYDKKVNVLNIEVGSRVLMKDPARTSKLSEVWIGPYGVIEVGEVTASIIRNGKVRKIHNNNLKLFYDE